MKRLSILCNDELHGARCALLAGHDGLHRAGPRVWGFRSPVEPEWVARMRAYGLPAKEMAA